MKEPEIFKVCTNEHVKDALIVQPFWFRKELFFNLVPEARGEKLVGLIAVRKESLEQILLNLCRIEADYDGSPEEGVTCEQNTRN